MWAWVKSYVGEGSSNNVSERYTKQTEKTRKTSDCLLP